MNLAHRRRALRALLALPLLAAPAAAQASGFAIESQGARAMGFAGAYVAQAADPSAIFYNAAGIAFLKGKQLYIAGAITSASTDFVGSGPYPPVGTLETSSNGLALLPAIYYSQPVSDRMVVGIGIDRPFASRSQWDNPDEFTGRYICLDCRLASWSINPTVAIRLADRFSIGGGIDVRLSKFQLSRRLIADPNPFPDPKDVAELTLDSSTKSAVGFNLGMLAMPTENFSIGVAYRHKVTIEHAAQADFVQILTGNTALDQAVAIALPGSQPATVGYTYPGSIAVGAALRRGYWTIEADFQWMLWSSFDQVAINYQNKPAFDTVLPTQWFDTWRGAIGIEYLIKDDWEVRGGYGYDHSPAPTETLSPFIHDNDRHTFNVGGSYKYEKLRLDFNLRYVLVRNAPTFGINSYGYNGDYTSHGLQFGAAFGYRF